MAAGKLRNFQECVKDDEMVVSSVPLKVAVAKDYHDDVNNIFRPIVKPNPQPLIVAVIGAGVAGLNTARELKKDGHEVVVYEKSDQIGGIWVYTPEFEDDPLGQIPDRKVVHSSLYASLRTNAPGFLMGFSDYPFRVGESRSNDYPGHADVLQFLNNFARDFGLFENIRFNTEVVRVEQTLPSDGGNRWLVESKTDLNVNSVELFEAVVICNGHYTQPRLGQLPGILHIHILAFPSTPFFSI